MTVVDVFQIWPQEDHTKLFRVENRRSPLINLQRQLLAVRRWSFHHRLCSFRDVFAGVRSQ